MIITCAAIVTLRFKMSHFPSRVPGTTNAGLHDDAWQAYNLSLDKTNIVLIWARVIRSGKRFVRGGRNGKHLPDNPGGASTCMTQDRQATCPRS